MSIFSMKDIDPNVRKPKYSADFSKNEEKTIISYDSANKPYSLYSDDKWKFISARDLNFQGLTGYFKETTKKLIYGVLFTEKKLYSSNFIQKNIIESAINFQKLIIKTGGSSFTFIDDDSNFRKLVIEAKKKKLKLKTWKNYLVFISKLHEKSFICRDIGNAEKLAIELAGHNLSVQQSMAIPERIAAKYFDYALKVITRYHPYRYAISRAYQNLFIEYKKSSSIWKTQANSKKYAVRNVEHNIPFSDFVLDLSGSWLSWLRGACYFVIAGFTGCRDGEIKSFNLASYEEKQYADVTIPIVYGEDSKPNHAGISRRISWVTIPAVKLAIELLWYSFEFARNEWREKGKNITHLDDRKKFLQKVDKIFLTLPHIATTHPSAGRQALSNSLENFAKSVDCRLTKEDIEEFNRLNPTRKGQLKVGDILIPHPHGFRRTFAVFLVRNRLGSLMELKYQFKHMNVAMTAWYSNQAEIAGYFDMMTDRDLINIIEEENHEFMTDTLYYIYNEAETLSGIEGKRILDARLSSPTTIYLSRDEISRQVKEGQMSIIEHPGGHCTNPSCNRICNMQTCRFKVVTKEKAINLVPERERLVKKFLTLKKWQVKQPNIMSKIYYDIKSIEQCFKDHDIPFTPFIDTIDVTML
ncbi:site-specific integrase [Spartinivicinus ruber]|uniref:hypothetical protein n=1 Tax=Spartinivicinus ruber TaxID=2683272 RepID=UPI001CA454E7|nr:hypothetical protein [Spartinivicinus ruber]